MNSFAVNFYLRSSLIPVMELLSGYVYVKAEGRIGKKPIALSFEVTQKIYEFDPLITEAWKSRVAGGKSAMRRPEHSCEETFPNLIPIEPLKFNLISIGEGVKLLNN